jgi:hypothetical protein
MRFAALDSQDMQVVKHGKPTVLADDSEQANESARLLVRTGSGKKLTTGNSEGRSCGYLNKVHIPVRLIAAKAVVARDTATLEFLDCVLD